MEQKLLEMLKSNNSELIELAISIAGKYGEPYIYRLFTNHYGIEVSANWYWIEVQVTNNYISSSSWWTEYTKVFKFASFFVLMNYPYIVVFKNLARLDMYSMLKDNIIEYT